jgi:hypothetical protein
MSTRTLQTAARLLVLALVVMAALSVQADASPAKASGCTSVRWSTLGGNGLSGGVVVWGLVLSNVGNRMCTVQGRPMVEVPPSRFPVQIRDVQPLFAKWAGADSPITLRPGKAAIVDVFIDGCAQRAKGQTARLTLRVGWANRAISIWGEACRVAGTWIEVGTFRTKP